MNKRFSDDDFISKLITNIPEIPDLLPIILSYSKNINFRRISKKYSNIVFIEFFNNYKIIFDEFSLNKEVQEKMLYFKNARILQRHVNKDKNVKNLVDDIICKIRDVTKNKFFFMRNSSLIISNF